MRNVGQRIYENNMEIKFSIRLDKKHIIILNRIVKEKGLDSKSDAIRYLIEKQDKETK